MPAKKEQHIGTLVVDGNDEDRRSIRSTLERSGIRVTSTPDGGAALERLRNIPYELLIVDLDLPGGVGGFRVAKAAKWRWPKMAIILSTRHPSLETAMQGIDLGVDGYLEKPASAERIQESVERALERRRERCCVETKGDLLERGSLRLDKERRVATFDGEPVHLTPTEFRILAHLMENAHRTVSPQELAEIARGEECPADEAAEIVRWHIHNLRQKIEPNPSRPHYVLNVHGVGYSLGGVR